MARLSPVDNRSSTPPTFDLGDPDRSGLVWFSPVVDSPPSGPVHLTGRPVPRLLAGLWTASALLAPVLAAATTPQAKKKAESIVDLLDGFTSTDDEKKILDILKKASDPELDGIIRELFSGGNLGWLFDDVDGDEEKALLALLSAGRLKALGVEARAAVIFALQEGHTDGSAEKTIAAIIKGTRGVDLTRLKNIIDSRSPQDLEKLVYHDIDSVSLRQEVLAHIEGEGRGLPGVGPLVVSDIDDTVVRNWVDPRYPAKTVYPGVRSFYAALQRPNASFKRAGPTFVTARPGERSGLFEDLGTVQKLQGYGFPNSTVLMGDFLHLTPNERIAEKKHENLKRYQRLFPECRMILVGDSGQGDIAWGKRALADSGIGVAAVFIHDVTSSRPSKQDGYVADIGILYFDTYIGAALAAAQRGLITPDDLFQVARTSVAEFGAMKSRLTPDQATKRRAEFLRDLRAAGQTYPFPSDLRAHLNP